MLTGLVSISVYVLNLENALAFYVDRLGFQVHTDIVIDSEKRWASVCMPDQPDNQLMLIPVEEGTIFTRQQAANLQDLIRHEVFSYGVFRCSNLAETYQELRKKGVKFLMKPGEGFLGQYEAAFTDDSGNWFRLTEDPDAV
ncbi:MAG: VOC family protein [Chitinophagaceae bacterium]|nr:MAG: VOC family protein [Chitinophagaceae bacterium]